MSYWNLKVLTYDLKIINNFPQTHDGYGYNSKTYVHNKNLLLKYFIYYTLFNGNILYLNINVNGLQSLRLLERTWKDI
jgi:hypothetical protein